MGIAGGLAIAMAILGGAAIQEQGADWRPLLLCMLGVALWAVMIARRSRSPLLEITAAASYLLGAVTFGIAEDSGATIGVGIVAGLLAGGFPRLFEAAVRLLERPAKVGMDWLVGQSAVVEHWAGSTGTVRAQGSLWNAAAPTDSAPGDVVDVVGFSGMTVTVAAPVTPSWRRVVDSAALGAVGVVLLVGLVLILASSVKIVQEYERAVIFRLGRSVGAKGPGVFFIFPIVDKVVKVNLQIIAAPVERQAVITKDNVTSVVDAVAYFQVVDAEASVIRIQNWYQARTGGADHPALDRRPPRAGSAAHRARADRHGAAGGTRRPDGVVGHQGPPGRDPRRAGPRADAAGDGSAGRGRARATSEGDRRRGRAPGIREAGGGGSGHQPVARRAAAPPAPDDGGALERAAPPRSSSRSRCSSSRGCRR